MAHAERIMDPGHDVIIMAREAVQAVEALFADASLAVRSRVAVERRIVERVFVREQRAAHGLAWLATYVEAIRQLVSYADRMHAVGRLGELEENTVRIGLGEYLAQIFGGIPMNQGEIVRLGDLGLDPDAVAARMTPVVMALMKSGNTPQRRARLVELICANPDPRLARLSMNCWK